MKDPARSAVRGRLVAVGFGVLVVLLVAGAAEILTRLVRPDLGTGSGETQFSEAFDHLRNLYHEPDDELLWRIRPGYRAESIRISDAGFRESESGDAPSRYDVASLGNSVTFGYTTPIYADTYPALLERALVDGGCAGVEVLNAGVVGYSSEQGRRYYERDVRPLSPRVVTLLYGYNDHHLSAESDAEKRSRSSTTALAWLRHSHAFRALESLVGAATSSGANGDGERDDRSGWRPRVSLSRFEANLAALVADVRADGATPVLVTVPIRPRVPLVETPIPLARDGTGRRVFSLNWMLARLPRDAARPVVRHIFGNEPLPASLARTIAPSVQAIQEEVPHWPLPHYLLGLAHESAGDSAAAAIEFEAAARLDTERQLLGLYNDTIRRSAERLGVALVDAERALTDLATHGDPTRVFADAVHPTAMGNAVIARELAATVAEALACR